jgi:hypothetical protein
VQVYVVGDNFRLVPRPSTRDFAAAAPSDLSLLFDSADLRASSKKEQKHSSSSSSSSSSSNHPVFACAMSAAAAPPAPPAALVELLLTEIKKMDVSLCATSLMFHTGALNPLQLRFGPHPR